MEAATSIRRINWYALTRVAVYFSLIAAVGLGFTSGEATNSSVQLIITGQLCILLGISLSSRKLFGPRTSTAVQLITDVLVVTHIVYLSGGPGSPFLFLYLGVAIAAAWLLPRSMALGVSLIAAVSYTALSALLINDLIPVHGFFTEVYIPPGGALLQIVGLSSALFLVVVATSFLVRRLHLTSSLFEASQREISHLTSQHETLANQISAGIITTDLEGKILTINQAAIEIFELKEDAVSKSLTDILESKLNGTDSTLSSSILKGDRHELTIERSSNSSLHLLVYRREVVDTSGNTTGAVYIFEDVTRLRSVEEQLALQERMARLLADQESSAQAALSVLPEFVGESPVMQQVFKLIGRVAPTDATVLIAGESGTGKELVAQAIHRASARSERPFVPVNCGAIPENLIESEFFGHKKGSFTGAVSDHIGLFQQAEGGTIFLDEIGELPLLMQTKLLRVLQERTVRSIGGSRDVPVNVRIIAATNRKLRKEVDAGRFREDLFYRLNVIGISLPALRERRDDLPLLVNAILRTLCGNVRLPLVSPAAMQNLNEYDYPGNVRELQNILERALVLGGEVILPEHLPESMRITAKKEGVQGRPHTEIIIDESVQLPVKLDDILSGLERRYLEVALLQTGGAKKRAADLLGINFRSLRYRLNKFGIDNEETNSN